MSIAKFSLAVDRPGKDKGADFISCTAFGKTADFVKDYLDKGTKVIIEGRWQTGSYEKDGHKTYTNDCIVNRIEFAESKKNSEKGETVTEDGDGFLDIPDTLDSELPFN